MALKQSESMGESNPMPHTSFGKKIFMVLGAVLMVYLTLYLGTLMRNNVKKYNYIGQADQMERTISINGVGKITGKNDIAVTTIGYSVVDKDVAKAQLQNKKVMDQVLGELKAMGIEEKDLTSNYSIYPEYDYTSEKGQTLRGYRVTNNVSVKIRDLSKISSVLALPGKYGANEVSGLSFTIDDPENLKSQARELALKDAKTKAMQMAEALGVRLVEIVSYSDYEVPGYQPYYGRAMDVAMNEKMAGPDIASGSQEINMNVSVVYKISSRKNW